MYRNCPWVSLRQASDSEALKYVKSGVGGSVVEALILLYNMMYLLTDAAPCWVLLHCYWAQEAQMHGQLLSTLNTIFSSLGCVFMCVYEERERQRIHASTLCLIHSSLSLTEILFIYELYI